MPGLWRQQSRPASSVTTVSAPAARRSSSPVGSTMSRVLGRQRGGEVTDPRDVWVQKCTKHASHTCNLLVKHRKGSSNRVSPNVQVTLLLEINFCQSRFFIYGDFRQLH